jgi:hypothetical protein
MSLYAATPDLSISTSLDSSLETTAHQTEEGAQEPSGAAIYRHAYRTLAVSTVPLCMNMWRWRQTASEHCLPQCGIKPIVSDSRKY